MPNRTMRLVTTSIVALTASAATLAQQFEYPKARKIDHVDTYHGVAVADPYRWLEDDNVRRDRGVGRGGEQGDVRLPRKDSFPKSLTDRVVALNNYEKVRGAVAEGRVRVLQARTTGFRTRASSTSRRACDGSTGGPDRSRTPGRRTARRS